MAFHVNQTGRLWKWEINILFIKSSGWLLLAMNLVNGYDLMVCAQYGICWCCCAGRKPGWCNRAETQTDGIKHSTKSASFTSNHLVLSLSLSVLISEAVMCCLLQRLSAWLVFWVQYQHSDWSVFVGERAIEIQESRNDGERETPHSKSEWHRYTRRRFAATKRLEVIGLQWRLAIWGDTSNSNRRRSEQSSTLC